MPALSGELRNLLEKTVIDAREAAETAAKIALDVLAVGRSEAPSTLAVASRPLRNALRARARQLGDGLLADGYEPLIEEVAYVQWHRLLFARFLAENHLLMHPSNVPVTLEECAELAAEEGETDGWALAARYAGVMLPGIFRPDDPVAQMRLMPEGQVRLERLVIDLPAAVLLADDGLGWVYQFWQSKKKDEINASGRKIGGRDLAAVTQLFTEDYMVRFLLENSLGAWWAARHPDSPLLKDWVYLRFRDYGTPAAGTFPGWPEQAAEITMMDPCCGSGHFEVVGFDMLRRMRMEEEGLSEAEAGGAVLRDNLFGLELDPRCTQIAAFALALAAWKHGGYRTLPLPNIACSGIPVQGQLEDWIKLANGDTRLEAALERLYELFRQAPDLGSLINPVDVPERDRMFLANYIEVEPLLERVLQKEKVQNDPVSAMFGAAAASVARATRFLAGKYVLVATNVPYLGRGKQNEIVRIFCDVNHQAAKGDLATVFVERCRSFTVHNGSYAIVSPQNWLFLVSYTKFRRRLLNEQSWNLLARLGANAFETIGGQVVNVVLAILSNCAPSLAQRFCSLDVSASETPPDKSALLLSAAPIFSSQTAQTHNPDSRILIEELDNRESLGHHATVHEGLHSGDYIRFGRKFWEFARLSGGWVVQQGSPGETTECSGREHVLFWEDGSGVLIDYVKERLRSETVTMWIKGFEAWGSRGIAVSPMSSLKATLYTGEVFTHSVVVIIPKYEEHLGPLWLYCQSDEFRKAVRALDRNICVAVAAFSKIPFDLKHWEQQAQLQNSSLTASTNNPTQWPFKGQPLGSKEPLEVGIVRLLGCRWPQQKRDSLNEFADEDGIVCIPAVAGEQPAAQRLRALLAAAYGADWSPARQQQLLAGVDYAEKGLDDWLRNGFFKQHCKLFQNRPFIWHVWDGLRDGFAVLVNYHKLDYDRLNRLIYTYLGEWIAVQRAERDAGTAGAEGKLVAALELQKKLEAIRDGEPPYDIYVRWKPLHEQPIGWCPDLNDGVRLNIRPFVTAGVLRSKFTIHWKKDRGRDPDGSERINDRHFTTAEKRAARRAAGSKE